MGSTVTAMEEKRVRRPQLRMLNCPSCGQRGLLKAILWGMPEEEFDYDNFASGGCVIPSSSPPDCRCSGCGVDAYSDEISGFDDGMIRLR